MSNSIKPPMDRFLDQYGPALREFDRQFDQLTPASLRSSDGILRMMERMHALQMHNWAAGIAAGKRHGFLKKVIEEIR